MGALLLALLCSNHELGAQTQWTRACGPILQQHVAAFDSVRGRTVLLGLGSGALETWEWDGVRWREARPATIPEFGPIVYPTFRRSPRGFPYARPHRSGFVGAGADLEQVE